MNAIQSRILHFKKYEEDFNLIKHHLFLLIDLVQDNFIIYFIIYIININILSVFINFIISNEVCQLE